MLRDITNSFSRMTEEELLAVIDNPTTDHADLSFAAEMAGRYPRSIPSLLTLIRHRNVAVREGAIYGLAPHTDKNEVCDGLYWVAKNDSNALIREIARSVLD